MATSRTEILDGLYELLDSSGLFYKVYKEPTDIERERSFPVCWLNVGSESIFDGTISTTNYMREVHIEVTIGTKHRTTDQNMNELIDQVFELVKNRYTLNGKVINVSPTAIYTDRGYFHPYALASLNFEVWIR